MGKHSYLSFYKLLYRKSIRRQDPNLPKIDFSSLPSWVKWHKIYKRKYRGRNLFFVSIKPNDRRYKLLRIYPVLHPRDKLISFIGHYNQSSRSRFKFRRRLDDIKNHISKNHKKYYRYSIITSNSGNTSINSILNYNNINYSNLTIAELYDKINDVLIKMESPSLSSQYHPEHAHKVFLLLNIITKIYNK